uniref:Cysteine rich secretory protein 2 n=1 Tax=Buteo japonicus TaxID=224669 RepID=A0A8C0BSS6_9AVES
FLVLQVLSYVSLPLLREPEGFDALSTSKASQQKLIVDRHNTLRRGVKPTASNMLKMEWCPPAAKNAQAWANQCTLSHSPGYMRRTTVQCGENLFMASAPFPWSDVIDAWYNEKEDFKYGTGAKTQGAVIGHYTQLIWYNSYQIGCAVAYCSKNQFNYFYVCQYCPAYKYQSRTWFSINISWFYFYLLYLANPCKYQDVFGNCRNLKTLFSCNNSLVKEKCPATCRCTTKII